MRKGDKATWLATAGALAAVALALFSAAIAFDIARKHYSLWSSAPMVAAYIISLAACACFIGAIRQWNIRLSRAQTVTQATLASHLLFLRNGRLPCVQEVSALELGIKPAIEPQRGHPAVELPPYLAREADSDLVMAIREGGLVLIRGRAASGKSRSAFEAIQKICPERKIVVPAHPMAIRDLLESNFNFSDCAIWLDDVERYLLSGGLDRGIVDRLSPPDEQDRAIVCTIRDAELARWRELSRADTTEYDSGPAKSARVASDFLMRIPDHRIIAVGQYLSESERSSTKLAEADPRIAAALSAETKEFDAVGFGEYLAAGPAMMDKWRVGDGALFDLGQALVSAAIECRRAGYDKPVPGAVIADIHRSYVSSARRNRADLPSIEEGFLWACRPVMGASSCLSPRDGDCYIASDYLLDRTQGGEGPLAGSEVHDSVWTRLLAIDDPEELASVGVHADWAGKLEVAETAYRIASSAGEAGGVINLGMFLMQQGRSREAEEHWLTAAQAGWHDAMYETGAILEGRGDRDAAREWYKGAAEGDDPRAMNSLGLMAEAEDRIREAENWFRRAANVEEIIWVKHTEAMLNLARLLEKRGRTREAVRWHRLASEYEKRYESEHPAGTGLEQAARSETQASS